MNDRTTASRLQWMLLSLGTLAAVWAMAALAADSRYLPGPAAVLAVMAAETASGEIPFHVGLTLARVTASFLLAMLIGSAIGVAMGRNRTADRLLDGWLIMFLNLPALVTIVLCYIWFGLTEVAVIVAVAVNKIPNVAATLREGARALDPEYEQMARVYRFGWRKTLRHVILPQLAPFLAAAARAGLALVWKIVLVVELLGRSNGVGFQINLSFQLFDVTTILAYALSFMIVVQAIEFCILQPWERRASRWRP